ncbi:hypothetical protein DP117_16220 [Brasilonema sp. UFV-L1]|nr:hypothetical protein [Brasilonema sp. UFV-L1]
MNAANNNAVNGLLDEKAEVRKGERECVSVSPPRLRGVSAGIRHAAKIQGLSIFVQGECPTLCPLPFFGNAISLWLDTERIAASEYRLQVLREISSAPLRMPAVRARSGEQIAQEVFRMVATPP